MAGGAPQAAALAGKEYSRHTRYKAAHLHTQSTCTAPQLLQHAATSARSGAHQVVNNASIKRSSAWPSEPYMGPPATPGMPHCKVQGAPNSCVVSRGARLLCCWLGLCALPLAHRQLTINKKQQPIHMRIDPCAGTTRHPSHCQTCIEPTAVPQVRHTALHHPPPQRRAARAHAGCIQDTAHGPTMGPTQPTMGPTSGWQHKGTAVPRDKRRSVRATKLQHTDPTGPCTPLSPLRRRLSACLLCRQ